jgi:phage portal protein BeeE
MPVPLSLRSQIADEILNRLALVTEYQYRHFDVVKLAASDFQDFELPAVQVIDLGEAVEHEQRRAKKFWQLAIEIIIGPEMTETPDQKDLWDLMEHTERTLFAEPNLNIPGVIHMQLVSTSTDLHFMKPFYVGRLEIAVQYYQPLVGTC